MSSLFIGFYIIQTMDSKFFYIKYDTLSARNDKELYAKFITEYQDSDFVIQSCLVSASNDDSRLSVYIHFDRPVTKEDVYELGEVILDCPGKQNIEPLTSRITRSAWLSYLIATDQAPAGFLGGYERRIISFRTHLQYYLNTTHTFNVFDQFITLYPECFPFIKECWENRHV